MKKFLPFVFPAIALIIVLFLAFRWYNAKTARTTTSDNNADTSSQFAEGEKIEDLSQSQANQMRKGASDMKSVDLTGSDGASGQVRYELKDGKVYFTVNANLPQIKDGVYQVWLKDVNGNAKRKAFTLEEGKGGFTGSAAIADSTLPFQVIVTKQGKNDADMTAPILTGTIQKDDSMNK